jgi:hypothetical protein
VTVTTAGRRQAAWRVGGGSYASASDPRLHFGLGSHKIVDTLEIRWPSGGIDRFHNLSGDTDYLIRESEQKPLPLDGFARTSNDRPRP